MRPSIGTYTFEAFKWMQDNEAEQMLVAVVLKPEMVRCISRAGALQAGVSLPLGSQSSSDEETHVRTTHDPTAAAFNTVRMLHKLHGIAHLRRALKDEWTGVAGTIAASAWVIRRCDQTLALKVQSLCHHVPSRVRISWYLGSARPTRSAGTRSCSCLNSLLGVSATSMSVRTWGSHGEYPGGTGQDVSGAADLARLSELWHRADAHSRDVPPAMEHIHPPVADGTKRDTDKRLTTPADGARHEARRLILARNRG